MFSILSRASNGVEASWSREATLDLIERPGQVVGSRCATGHGAAGMLNGEPHSCVFRILPLSSAQGQKN